MLRRYILIAALIADALLLADLLQSSVFNPPALWLSFHVLCSILVAVCVHSAGDFSQPAVNRGAISEVLSSSEYWLSFVFTLLIPGLGGVAYVAASVLISRRVVTIPDSAPTMQTVAQTDLPFHSPKGRTPTTPDHRGLAEHILYSSNDEDIYRKVLAAGHIKDSLAVDALRKAMCHPDERIRLTAYKTLDAKVNNLNRTIQDLEARIEHDNSDEHANIWVQIAGNYWELLTLNGSEPVARDQLMRKAAEAAIKAVSLLPDNRNAHYLLGRISLVQNQLSRAKVAFNHSMRLGMPADKVAPYLAECAFMERDFDSVGQHLRKLNSASMAYPPLSHVVEQWA